LADEEEKYYRLDKRLQYTEEKLDNKEKELLMTSRDLESTNRYDWPAACSHDQPLPLL